MNKKGFTLIEIILVLIIISVIGTISIVSITSNKNEKYIVKIQNKVLEAASVYANIEKDSNGMTIAKTVDNYAKGVKIPLNTLIDKGYLDSEEVDTLENKFDKNNKGNLYVLLVNKKNYCQNGAEYILSWTMDESVPIYLCDNKSGSGGPVLTDLSIIQENIGKDTSGANPPELSEKMIPVVYDEDKKVWVKADINNYWYNYDKQIWANIVTVKELSTEKKELENINSSSKLSCTSENGFCSEKEYLEASPGTIISDKDIRTHFVWIPKFEFQIGYALFASSYSYVSAGGYNYYDPYGNQYYQPQNSIESIEMPVMYTNYIDGKNHNSVVSVQTKVNFVDKDYSTQDENGNDLYILHPAFEFGGNELSGIWVGKYETSGTKDEPYIRRLDYINGDINDVLTTSISEGFYILKDNLIILNDNENFDLHLSKNSEWAVLSYLTTSKYGLVGGNKTNLNDALTGIVNSTGNAYGVYGLNTYNESVMHFRELESYPNMIITDCELNHVHSGFSDGFTCYTGGTANVHSEPIKNEEIINFYEGYKSGKIVQYPGSTLYYASPNSSYAKANPGKTGFRYTDKIYVYFIKLEIPESNQNLPDRKYYDLNMVYGTAGTDTIKYDFENSRYKHGVIVRKGLFTFKTGSEANAFRAVITPSK